jgi:hypothetical protein
MSNDNTRDANEPSPASAVSQPVAWAVLRIDGSIYDVYANEEEAKAIDEAVTGNHGVVTLCRSPTLTDAERQAIFRAMYRAAFVDSAVLGLLLERTK